jgi:hypothetical protein
MEYKLSKKRSLLLRLFNTPPLSKQKRYMMLALNAVLLAQSQPTIMTSEAKQFSKHLQRYKRHVLLFVGRIKKDEVCLRLQRLIADEPV